MKSKTPNQQEDFIKAKDYQSGSKIGQIIERARPFLKEFYLCFTDCSKDCIDCGRKYWANG